MRKMYVVRPALGFIRDWLKRNKATLIVALIMAITWLAGFLLGAMMMTGLLGGV